MKVEVNVILNSQNIKGIQEFQKLSQDLGIKFRYDGYLPFSRNDFLSITDEEYIKAIYSIDEMKKKFLKVNEINNINHSYYFGAGNTYVFISASGEVGFCPTLSNSSFSGGRLEQSNLRDIWYNSQFFNHTRNIRCKFYEKCPINYICKGGCRSRAILMQGDIGSTDIQECKLAYRITGILPTSMVKEK